jgi:hypothetical protein
MSEQTVMEPLTDKVKKYLHVSTEYCRTRMVEFDVHIDHGIQDFIDNWFDDFTGEWEGISVQERKDAAKQIQMRLFEALQNRRIKEPGRRFKYHLMLVADDRDDDDTIVAPNSKGSPLFISSFNGDLGQMLQSVVMPSDQEAALDYLEIDNGLMAVAQAIEEQFSPEFTHKIFGSPADNPLRNHIVGYTEDAAAIAADPLRQPAVSEQERLAKITSAAGNNDYLTALAFEYAEDSGLPVGVLPVSAFVGAEGLFGAPGTKALAEDDIAQQNGFASFTSTQARVPFPHAQSGIELAANSDTGFTTTRRAAPGAVSAPRMELPLASRLQNPAGPVQPTVAGVMLPVAAGAVTMAASTLVATPVSAVSTPSSPSITSTFARSPVTQTATAPWSLSSEPAAAGVAAPHAGEAAAFVAASEGIAGLEGPSSAANSETAVLEPEVGRINEPVQLNSDLERIEEFQAAAVSMPPEADTSTGSNASVTAEIAETGEPDSLAVAEEEVFSTQDLREGVEPPETLLGRLPTGTASDAELGATSGELDQAALQFSSLDVPSPSAPLLGERNSFEQQVSSNSGAVNFPSHASMASSAASSPFLQNSVPEAQLTSSFAENSVLPLPGSVFHVHGTDGGPSVHNFSELKQFDADVAQENVASSPPGVNTQGFAQEDVLSGRAPIGPAVAADDITSTGRSSDNGIRSAQILASAASDDVLSAAATTAAFTGTAAGPAPEDMKFVKRANAAPPQEPAPVRTAEAGSVLKSILALVVERLTGEPSGPIFAHGQKVEMPPPGPIKAKEPHRPQPAAPEHELIDEEIPT